MVVNVSVGKNVVCVVLILVLVVCSVCLVDNMFGCCSSMLDGRLVGSGVSVMLLFSVCVVGSRVVFSGVFISNCNVL